MYCRQYCIRYQNLPKSLVELYVFAKNLIFCVLRYFFLFFVSGMTFDGSYGRFAEIGTGRIPVEEYL